MCIRDRFGGFTLIELLVAMAIFSVVMVVTINIFLTGLKGVRRVFNQQNILDSGRFILESVSKELRMSKINTEAGGPYTSINITDSKGNDMNYSFGETCDAEGCLTPSNVDMPGYFYIKKSEELSAPPRVTLVMKIINKDVIVAEQKEIYLQTTVSSREYGE